jgi:acetoin utilization protein AcuC
LTRRYVFIHSDELEKYAYPSSCPFNISRAGGVRKTLASLGLLSGDGRREVAPEPAARAVLQKFHSARYLDALQAAAAGGMTVESLYMGIGSPDCPVFADMYEYAILACGATLKGAQMILSGEAIHAFNPSGGYHHAGPEKAAGFCYINDVAIACGVLAEAGKRVLYLDVDVHHGDGVQDEFYDRADVMTISFHESGHTLFPGTGHEDEIGVGAGKGYCVNVPLPAGTYDQAYMWAFKTIALPLTKAYNPDVIVLEMGADTLAGDPLAHLQLTNNTCADIIHAVLSFDKPVLMTGGGGYHVANTVRAWALAWSVLCGADAEHQDAHIGLGGVMLESTDWQGGLRDRQLPVDIEQSEGVIAALEATVARIKRDVFPLHGL